MKALVIGYGSIGRRHVEILSSLEEIDQVDIVTKQEVKNYRTYNSLQVAGSLSQYDYFVISTETVKHYDHLSYLCSTVQNKKILVEKPLSECSYPKLDLNNQVYVAYNLRFHAVLQEVKKHLDNRKILLANIICGQYLPQWRPDMDYRKCYSAFACQGGGVLRDLSHELDYCYWLFGEFKDFNAINRKVSSLDIDSDDIFVCIGTTDKEVVVSISLDYISKRPIRQLIIHCDEITVFSDLVNNIVEIVDVNQKTQKRQFTTHVDDTYRKMHQNFINDQFDHLCTYEQARSVVNFFDKNQINSVEGK